MAENSKIQWTEATWNPLAGCTEISPGCQNCYAAVMAHRLEAMGQKKYAGAALATMARAAIAFPMRAGCRVCRKDSSTTRRSRQMVN